MSIKSTETINLDEPFDLWEYDILPEWAQKEICEERGEELYQVFPSKETRMDALMRGSKEVENRELFPVTVFSLLQLLTTEQNSRYFTSEEIRRRHKDDIWKGVYKYDSDTYWLIFQRLLEYDLIQTEQYDGKVQYGLPEGESVSPIFDDSHSDCQLENIVVDSPTLKEEYKSTWVPIATRGRVLKSKLQGPFGTLFRSGFIFAAAGAVLSVGYADGTFLNLFDPTTPLLAVFGAIISVGIASMFVALLDHISLHYDIATKR